MYKACIIINLKLGKLLKLSQINSYYSTPLWGTGPPQSKTSSRWRHSPRWALASATICLQVSRFLALSLHSFIPIFLRSMDMSSSHLILGLPRLVAYSFPYSIFFGIVVSCILSICPSHHIIWHLINLTMFSPLIMASNSPFCRVLHNSFSFNKAKPVESFSSYCLDWPHLSDYCSLLIYHFRPAPSQSHSSMFSMGVPSQRLFQYSRELLSQWMIFLIYSIITCCAQCIHSK